MDEKDRGDWLFSAMEEYKSLREEILEANKLQYLSIQIGLTTVGALTAILSILPNNRYLPQIFLFVLIPSAVYISYFLWTGENEKIVHIGAYLTLFEKKVGDLFNDSMPNPLSWETYLREPIDRSGINKHLTSNYKYVTVLCLVAALTSVSIGNTNYFAIKLSLRILIYIDFIEILIFLAVLAYAFQKGKLIKTINNDIYKI